MQHSGDTTLQGVHRKPQWIYLVPVIGAPLAHIFVSLTKQYPKHTRTLVGAAAAATAAMVWNRMYLMADSGYPGAEREKPEREEDVHVPLRGQRSGMR